MCLCSGGLKGLTEQFKYSHKVMGTVSTFQSIHTDTVKQSSRFFLFSFENENNKNKTSALPKQNISKTQLGSLGALI